MKINPSSEEVHTERNSRRGRKGRINRGKQKERTKLGPTHLALSVNEYDLSARSECKRI
jgi:hypothetical protein